MKPLLLLIGKSGSGKDFISQLFNSRNVVSHTTREPREGEVNGVNKWFETKDSMKELILRQVLAYTKIEGNVYCATIADVEDKDVYIIDPAGVEFFKEQAEIFNYKRPITVLYIYAVWYKRLYRMIRRDGVSKAVKRFWSDRVTFKNLQYDYKIIN